MVIMRTAFQFALAVMVSAVSFSSCTKNLIQDNGSDPAAPATEGTRTIAVSFAPQTKTALGKDGLTPEFQAGYDTIKVAKKDGSASPEDCPVYIENEVAVIHTDLEGDLVAVYPSSAASIDGNVINGVRVPSKQTGKFADANICSATILAGSQSATFKNETAILKFYVDKSIGVKSITIGNKENIADNSSIIKIDETDESSILSEITKENSNERICYVAVLAGIHSALQFTSETSTQSAPVQKQLQPVTLLPGTMYNVFLPYYIQVGDQKWGYCNVGAFLPEEPGYYFSWGNTEGFIRRYNETTENSEWIYPSGQPAPAGGFTDNNYSLTTGYSITVNLTAENDAATVAWQGDWRMPTKSEYETLCSATHTWGTYSGGQQKGYYFGTLFFPAVGRGIYENLEYTNKKSYYWSSTINDTHPYYLHFEDDEMAVNTELSRSQGFSIRPIYGAPTPEVSSDALPGKFTVAVDATGQGLPPTKVRFSKGNLQATYNGSDYNWGFAKHQYDYIGETSGNLSMDSPKNGDVVDLFGWVGKSSSLTGAAGYGISLNENSEDYSKDVNDVLKSDWGNTIDNKGTWRTLSKDEWNYLLNLREMPNNGIRYQDRMSGITLKDEKDVDATGYGIVLFPDGFTDQETWYNAYKSWDEFAQNGLVFLPAAGRRNGDYIEYYGKNEHCYYWSSTHESTSPSWALYLWIYSGSNPEISDIWCSAGNAVRLVTNTATNK